MSRPRPDTVTEGDETFKVTMSVPTGNPLPGGVTLSHCQRRRDHHRRRRSNGVGGGRVCDRGLGGDVQGEAFGSGGLERGAGRGRRGTTTPTGARQATAGTDYTAVSSGSVTITASQTEATFTVSTTAGHGDGRRRDVQGDDERAHRQPCLPGGVTITTASATGTITDDDRVTVSVEAGSATEGSAVTFKAKLSAAVSSNVVLGWVHRRRRHRRAPGRRRRGPTTRR